MTTEFTVSADGTKIAYVTHGSGPPLIFAHGASGDKFACPDLQRLLQKHHAVTAYDRRGRGESKDHQPYDFMKEADDLRAIVKAVRAKPIVFGISMGARIALEMLRNPPDLSGLVLFEAPATDQVRPEFENKLAQVRLEMASNGNEAGTVLHSRLFHQRNDRDIEILRRDPERWKLRVESFPITLREMEAVHRDCLFSAENYQRPSFDVHLLTGDATLSFLQGSAALLSGLPFVQTHRLKNGNHSEPSDNPQTVIDAFTQAMRTERA